MKITAGILKRKYKLSQGNLVGGLCLWILATYILYAFFQLYREAFRFFTSQRGDQTLLVLTPSENYIYNLFLASIASALGYSIALRFILQNSLHQRDWRTKSIIRRTLNTQGFFTWSFLLWFGKLGSLLGIWYLTYAIQYDLDLIREFSFMLLLLPLVLFYSSWPNFCRLIRTERLWWFLKLTGLFVIMSFGFAFKNFTDYEKINEHLLSSSIEHTFDLQVPVSQSHEKIIRRSTAIDVYIVRDTIRSGEPAIFFEDIVNRVDLQDVQKVATVMQEEVSVYERYQLIANLHIDERISIRHINRILDELRKAGLGRIQYSTGRKYSRYPNDYPAFRYSGIQKVLPKYSPQFKQFLDSVEQIDLSGKAFKLYASPIYRNGALKNYNRIEITVTCDSIALNGQQIEPLHLEQKLYGFIKKYSPHHVIIFSPDDEITYKKYIEILDILWTQVDRLRDEMSIELYGEPFDYWYWKPEQDTIKRKFPRHILEWSTEEQRLNELMKKAENRY